MQISEYLATRGPVKRGRGFPSLSKEIARLPVNRNDPNGYYATLGLPPWATTDEVKSQYRALAKICHPDSGVEPDPDAFQRLTEIYDVLTTPELRTAYISTPPGNVFVDRLVMESMRESMSNLSAQEMAETIDKNTTSYKPKSAEEAPESTADEPTTESRPEETRIVECSYDFQSVDYQPEDEELAEEWYRCLVKWPKLVGLKSDVRLLIFPEGEKFQTHPAGWVAVPRGVEPSETLALGLLFDLKKKRQARYTAWTVASTTLLK